METPAALPPETARLLEQSIMSAEAAEQCCEAFLDIPLQDHRELTRAADSIVANTAICYEHIREVLADPHLQQCMDCLDRRALSSLLINRSSLPDSAERQFSRHERHDPLAMSTLFKIFCSTRSDVRFGASLQQGVRWSLRHRLRPHLTMRPLQERQPKKPVHVRWLIDRDKPQVLAIDGESFPSGWTRRILDNNQKARSCIGMVAEERDGSRILGFMVYELHKGLFHILRFAVDPGSQRQDIGSQMIEKVIGKLSDQKRDRILLLLDERVFLPSARFCTRQGCQIVARIPDSSGDDRYLLEHRIASAPSAQQPQERHSALWVQPDPVQYASDSPSSFAVTEWDPADVHPWTPDQLNENDRFGLWGDRDE